MVTESLQESKAILQGTDEATVDAVFRSSLRQRQSMREQQQQILELKRSHQQEVSSLQSQISDLKRRAHLMEIASEK